MLRTSSNLDRDHSFFNNYFLFNPLEIDYDNDSVESIMEKIEYAIEQHPSFLKVIPEEVLKAKENLNVTRQWDF